VTIPADAKDFIIPYFYRTKSKLQFLSYTYKLITTSLFCSLCYFTVQSFISFLSLFFTHILLTFVFFFLISFFLLLQLCRDILGSDAFDDVLHSVLQRPSHRARMRPNNGRPSQRRTNWWTFRLIIIIITTYEEFRFHYFHVE
jgi:hypothetical protein